MDTTHTQHGCWGGFYDFDYQTVLHLVEVSAKSVLQTGNPRVV